MTSSSSMKIAIAKSLMEPVGIPWPLISIRVHEASIKIALAEFFIGLREEGVLPKPDEYRLYSAETVSGGLAERARLEGADTVRSTNAIIQREGKHVGWVFLVEFTIPSDNKRFYRIHFKSI